MITPLNAINRTENFGYSAQKSPLNSISANNMPNGLLRVPHIDNSKNMNNHNVNEYKKWKKIPKKFQKIVQILLKNFEQNCKNFKK